MDLKPVEKPNAGSNTKWWIIGVGAGVAVVGGIVAAILAASLGSQEEEVYPSSGMPPIILD